MAIVISVTEEPLATESWVVVLGNGRYFANVSGSHPSAWSAGANVVPDGHDYARSTQKVEAWSSPRNVATNGSGFYATTKPPGTLSGDGSQYVYNSAEDPPAGNWNGVEAGDYTDVIYDTANSRYVRVNHRSVHSRTFLQFSNNGVNFGSAADPTDGQNDDFTDGTNASYQIYYATIANSTFVGVYQSVSSDPGGHKGNRILVNSGSNFAAAETSIASTPNTAIRLGRPHYGDGVWYVGYTSGVLKSTDGGDTWTDQEINHGSDTCRIQSLSYSTGTGTWIAVGTVTYDVNGGTGIILRSTDGGTTWSPVKTGGIASGGFFAVATDHNGTWLVGGQNREVYRSMNDGVSWVGPIATIYNDSFDGNSHYDVISILYEANRNI